MARRPPAYFPKHIDQSVRDMTYAADAAEYGTYIVDLGTPPLADADYFIAGGSISASTIFSTSTFTFVNHKAAERYGVNVQGAAVTGFTTDTVRAVTITGRDYLGQLMTETIQMLTPTGESSQSST